MPTTVTSPVKDKDKERETKVKTILAPPASSGGTKSPSKKDVTRSAHGGVEETLKKAAEDEAERQRQVAAAAEEAKLQAQREEELKLKKQKSMAMLLPEEKQKDLVAWIKSVPLSDGCIDRIDRAFSDGSLVAEVIHHFCPRICDKRQYFKWHSTNNKLSNWEALNRKVFPKLGFHLNKKQIENILNPYSCGKYEKNCESGMFIYKLLDKIRKQLAIQNPAVFEYQKSDFVSPVCEDKKPPRKLNNYLDNPPFSKVEWLVEQGFYDRNKDKDKTDTPTSDNRCKVCTSSKSQCSFEIETVPYTLGSVYGCITFEENGQICDQVVLQPTYGCNWQDASGERCFYC